MRTAVPAWVLLIAMTIILGLSPLGYLRVAGLGEALTIVHLPVILAAILEGPLAGAGAGLVFGLLALSQFPPADPLVHLLPRILMGVVAGLTFQGLRQMLEGGAKTSLAALAAALAGSLTNTFGVCLLGVARGHFRSEEITFIVVVHGLVEAAIALLVLVPASVWLTHQKE